MRYTLVRCWGQGYARYMSDILYSAAEIGASTTYAVSQGAMIALRPSSFRTIFLVRTFASVISTPVASVSFETSQLYSTSISGVNGFWFEMRTANEIGPPDGSSGGSSTPGFKTIGRMTTTVPTSIAIMSRSRRDLLKPDLGAGRLGDTVQV
jgi:hypothetical protein